MILGVHLVLTSDVSLVNVSVHEFKKCRQLVHYVSNETSLPSGLLYVFSWNFAEWCGADFKSMFFLDIYFCNVRIDFVGGALQFSFQHVEDSRLKALIQDLPAVLLKSKTVNTTKKYERGFNAWRKWASH